jgi:excisionase family DNA binding protein
MNASTDNQSGLRGLTVAQAAHQLGIGRTLVYSLISDRVICPVKLGRRTVIPADQILDILSGKR